MGRKASKGARTKDLPKLIAKSESFGEFASMCFAGFKLGGVK